MRPYRDEEAGLRARLQELEEQARRRDERLTKLRAELKGKGWVPRAAVTRQRWFLVALVFVTALLMVLSHLLVFQPRREERPKVIVPEQPLPDSPAELRSLRKRYTQLMDTLGALHGMHYKVHHGQWSLELDSGFLVLDGEQVGEARVLVTAWARRYGQLDYQRIYSGLTAAQRARLSKLWGRP